ncbi:Chromatin regulatory protein sir2 [Taphrina deformans PYCC 5710]|uniref:Chromatin regulatory protein sir2 n=1 Tax=Taphrina deformans (strain PYCC 5710 / ATCC 11124 / CBS 356.35 / IMI 108563 / JCM 9778 / NBRC 8474) TaxID=1097556 RepID=R4X7D0_TAPDE|nr:Chromatin regulatory protein sir2 [Taphrina deformans PYCC 5710]|eukprot:CCG81257.1 Chromatin regulatory protein sir2 [Taphrina deformans PYCC 5710]
MTDQDEPEDAMSEIRNRVRDKDEAGPIKRLKTALDTEQAEVEDESSESDAGFSETEDVLDLIAHMERDEKTVSLSTESSAEIKKGSAITDIPEITSDTIAAEPDTNPTDDLEHVERELRQDLKTLGVEGFLEEYLLSKATPVRTLLERFGLKLPKDFEEIDDQDLVPILRVYLIREYSKRERLPDVKTVEDVATLLQSCKNIIVITGAGISTSLGIPDFRSEGGIYSRLEEYNLTDPQELFDIHLFRESPYMFYNFAKELIPVERGYSPTHAFIRLLQDQGRLLRQYTQNIDNIESTVGIDKDRLVQCHGSFKSATCLTCHKVVPGETIFDDIRRGNVPRCADCIREREATNQRSKNKRRKRRKRPRSGSHEYSKRWDELNDDDEDEEEEESIEASGYALMKPDITFFGEQLSTDFKTQIMKDKDEADLVLCIGTSLRVQPVADIPRLIPKHIPQIFISREKAGREYVFDVELLGTCDSYVSHLVKQLGLTQEFELLVKHGKSLATDVR